MPADDGCSPDWPLPLAVHGSFDVPLLTVMGETIYDFFRVTEIFIYKNPFLGLPKFAPDGNPSEAQGVHNAKSDY
ncbi:MAG: hypothetical protein A4E49_02136 [Methanosaeta sp. PtaU1.Bin112]|nr:MAG: hypothetical protein A4E49_02136 [Methanosaeta sp. PtaU1.Bin112]